jgi:hypothetical protein
MLQKNFLTPELHAVCDVCSEAVTNPLCPACLAGEINVWLDQYPALKVKLSPAIKKYVRLSERADGVQCIKCNEFRTSVCPYCFTEYVLKELHKLNAKRVVLAEFLEFFNFDLEHCGYSREAEMLGVI